MDRLKRGLAKTRARFAALAGLAEIDSAQLEELEEILLASDAGVDATRYVLDQLRRRARADRPESLKAELRSILLDLLTPLERAPSAPQAKPWVIMLVGVNGAGKTTAIGKLAKHFRESRLSVLLAGSDTFRAAAQAQLAAWAGRNEVEMVSQSGGDPAAIAFDAVSAARARGIDVMIADTAGRLPTQLHLMDELRKIKRVVTKAEAGAPHEIWLVLDGNTGQNGLAQVRAFDEALGLTGLIVTKLDGTAKGGVVCAVAFAQASAGGKSGVPIRFVGVGEGIDDLRPFVAEEFVDALIG